jgi:hypothetical protein
MPDVLIPNIETNFTPLPHALVEVLLRGSLSREAMLAVLYTVHTTYGWRRDGGAVTPADVAQTTGCTADTARRGLEEATRRGILVRLAVGDGSPSFLLATAENRSIVTAYGSVEAAPAPDDDLPEPDIEAGVPDLDDSSAEILPFEDEVAGPEPVQPASPQAPEVLDLPFHPRTVEMLIKLVGRPLTKDERMRLADIGASDTEIIEAMSSLLSKTTQIYSTDLVIYEYERLRSRARQTERYERSKEEREEILARQKGCPRCEGLGYIFVGVNNIRECECRKK